MHATKINNQLKDYEKQQKMLRAAKKSDASTKQVRSQPTSTTYKHHSQAPRINARDTNRDTHLTTLKCTRRTQPCMGVLSFCKASVFSQLRLCWLVLAQAEDKAAKKKPNNKRRRGKGEDASGMVESNDREEVLIARPMEYLVRFEFREVRVKKKRSTAMHAW